MEIGEEGERMILLRFKDYKPRIVKIGNNSKKFLTERYFLVDLSSNPTSDEDVVVHDLPSLLDTLQYNNASLVADPKTHTIYLIGGKEPCRDVELMAESITSQINFLLKSPFCIGTTESEFYTGAARLDLKNMKQLIRQFGIRLLRDEPIGRSFSWAAMLPLGLPPFENPWYTVCTALDGCIYNLGSSYEFGLDKEILESSCYKELDYNSDLYDTLSTYRKLCKPMVFNPDKGCWVGLDPGTYEGHVVATPLLSDPVNKRILVHFPMIKGVKSMAVARLFAFHPDKPTGENWVPLDCPNHDRHPWIFASAVVDNLIYFRTQLKPLVAAYDIDKDEWLNVQWSEPPLYKNDGLTYDAVGVMEEFQYMLLLAIDIFCLIADEIVRINEVGDESAALPYFLKFRFERKGDTVTLTPMCARSIVIENNMMMLDCASV